MAMVIELVYWFCCKGFSEVLTLFLVIALAQKEAISCLFPQEEEHYWFCAYFDHACSGAILRDCVRCSAMNTRTVMNTKPMGGRGTHLSVPCP